MQKINVEVVCAGGGGVAVVGAGTPRCMAPGPVDGDGGVGARILCTVWERLAHAPRQSSNIRPGGTQGPQEKKKHTGRTRALRNANLRNALRAALRRSIPCSHLCSHLRHNSTGSSYVNNKQRTTTTTSKHRTNRKPKYTLLAMCAQRNARSGQLVAAG